MIIDYKNDPEYLYNEMKNQIREFKIASGFSNTTINENYYDAIDFQQKQQAILDKNKFIENNVRKIVKDEFEKQLKKHKLS